MFPPEYVPPEIVPLLVVVFCSLLADICAPFMDTELNEPELAVTSPD